MPSGPGEGQPSAWAPIGCSSRYKAGQILRGCCLQRALFYLQLLPGPGPEMGTSLSPRLLLLLLGLSLLLGSLQGEPLQGIWGDPGYWV